MGKPVFRLFVGIALMLFTGLNAVSASATETGALPEKADLSPYFFIEGGDSGTDHLPLKKTIARVNLNGFIASVTTTQVYRNEGDRPLNARYIFPGSTRAAVNGMTMTIGERRIAARIREKEEAKQIFEVAKKAGKSASLLSQKRPNVFSMDVANILPGDEIRVELTYTELLSAEDGIYEFVYPGVVGPRYGGDAGHSALEADWIENPYLAEGTPDGTEYSIEVQMTSPLPIQSLESSSHELQTDWQAKNSVSITLADNTLTGKKDAGNRDFILHYRLQGEQILTGLTRFQAGEENYFLLVGEPPKRVVPEQLPARDYFFVVDVSGSMHGFPLDVTRQLMADLLGNLKPGDRFNILFFAGGSQLLSPQPLTASPRNISLALQMMNSQSGGGGTQLYPALQRALDMSSDEDTSRSIVVVTDGYISAEQRVFSLIDDNLHRNNVFAFGIGTSVNRHLIEGIARAGRSEAFVVTSRKGARQTARKFGQYIAAPVLTNIRVEAGGMEIYDLEPAQVPDMLAQRPIMIIGKYRNAGEDARLTLRGSNGEGDQQWTFPLADASDGDSVLPQLWARKRLEHLYVIPHPDAERQRQEILELGLNYSLLTRHTSFVAVDETVRNPGGNAEDVKQPLPLPQGVSNLAVGRPMPEPELLWLLTIMVLTLLWQRRRLLDRRILTHG